VLIKFRQNWSKQEVIRYVLRSTNLLMLSKIRKNCHSSGMWRKWRYESSQTRIVQSILTEFSIPMELVAAGMAQWYSAGLRAGWFGVWAPAGARNFSLYHCLQTGSEAHPASYLMGTRGYFPGGKAAGMWTGHSHTSSAEVKNAWSYTSSPLYAFLSWCSIKKGTGATLRFIIM
jgi:hypothetical protein